MCYNPYMMDVAIILNLFKTIEKLLRNVSEIDLTIKHVSEASPGIIIRRSINSLSYLNIRPLFKIYFKLSFIDNTGFYNDIIWTPPVRRPDTLYYTLGKRYKIKNYCE